ncbi:stress response nst1-like isoform X1 [Octopus vulgaris]|uniref:Stress response nst1-like isoform X1 n=1 Tax=Octopus vulgaris TaxID=6645 RepID=A0AA36F0M2_OCTVU|nr:stress response nst1-like isoform X1 [Octopus vulgaris]
MSRKRHEMSAEEREQERTKDRQRRAKKKQAMSPEERTERLAKERQRIARIRQAMSVEKRQEVRDKERLRMAKRRKAMTDEERKELLVKNRLRFARKKLARLTDEGQGLLAKDQKRKMRRKQMTRNENARNQQRMFAELSNQCYSEESMKQQYTEQVQTDDQLFDADKHMINTQVSQIIANSLQIASQMPVQQCMDVAQSAQIPVPKPNGVRKPWHQRKRILAIDDHQRKRILAVADHQLHVMSNLAALWKSKKLCDASIGNGSSTVMVHKVILSAVCPKLLSVFSTNISSQKFLQINFPEEVSTQALNAFAEYMYNGYLDLDPDILQQLKIIAKQLEMKKFEEMCDNNLINKINQPSTDLRQNQTQAGLPVPTNITVPTVQPSLPSSSITSVTSQSTPSFITQVIDVKQEICEAALAQVKNGTAGVIEQESEIDSLDANTYGDCSNDSDFVLRVKTEPVGLDNEKYGQLNNEAYISTPVSSNTVSHVIYGPTCKLKSNVFEGSIVSDLPPVSCIEEKRSSQSISIQNDASKMLHQSIATIQSIENIMTSGSNEGVYPIRLFTAGRDNVPLCTQHTNLKHVGLYEADDLM